MERVSFKDFIQQILGSGDYRLMPAGTGANPESSFSGTRVGEVVLVDCPEDDMDCSDSGETRVEN